MKAKTKLKFYEGCHTALGWIENCIGYPLYWIGAILATVVAAPIDWLKNKIYDRERALWDTAWKEMEEEKQKAVRNVPYIS
jgi:hypothetical protein